MKKITIIAAFILLLTSNALAEEAPSVFFENLKDGQTIASSYVIKMGVQGMKVAPAGQIVAGEGHHHLIIDGDFVPERQVIPADAKHIHFGKGQTEYELLLPAGKHKLTLQFADGAHLSYGKQMSATVTVEVLNDIHTMGKK